MCTVGDTVEESKVVEKILRVIPKRLSHVAVTIEVTADLSKLMLEDVGGQLWAAEDRAAEDKEPAPMRVNGKLYLTEEQWLNRQRQRGDASGQGSSKNGRGSERRRRSRKRTGGGGKQMDTQVRDGSPRDDACRNCGRTGH